MWSSSSTTATVRPSIGSYGRIPLVTTSGRPHRTGATGRTAVRAMSAQPARATDARNGTPNGSVTSTATGWSRRPASSTWSTVHTWSMRWASMHGSSAVAKNPGQDGAWLCHTTRSPAGDGVGVPGSRRRTLPTAPARRRDRCRRRGRSVGGVEDAALLGDRPVDVVQRRAPRAGGRRVAGGDGGVHVHVHGERVDRTDAAARRPPGADRRWPRRTAARTAGAVRAGGRHGSGDLPRPDRAILTRGRPVAVAVARAGTGGAGTGRVGGQVLALSRHHRPGGAGDDGGDRRDDDGADRGSASEAAPTDRRSVGGPTRGSPPPVVPSSVMCAPSRAAQGREAPAPQCGDARAR